MKITFILPYYPWRVDGGYKVVFTYANELVKAGHEVCLVYPRYFRHSARGFRQLFRIVDYVYTPPIRWHDIDPRIRIKYVPEPTHENIPPGDVVIITFWAAVEYLKTYPEECGRGYYLVQGYEDWFGPKDMVDAALAHDMPKIVVSRWLRAKLMSLGVKDAQIAYIPNRIDPVKYPLLSPIECRSPCVVMVYSKLWFKGGEEGLKAIRMVREKWPKIRAIVFSTYRRPRDAPDWMEWHHNPRHEEIVDIYNQGTIYLCSSYSEAWHLCPAEAMSCGCALVSTDIGGVEEYSIHMETALLSRPGDCRALAGNIALLLEDDALRIRIAQAGHKRIGDSGDWGENTLALERFIVSQKG